MLFPQQILFDYYHHDWHLKNDPEPNAHILTVLGWEHYIFFLFGA